MSYMRDANGRRLDSFAVQALADNPRRLVSVGSKARYLHQSTSSNGTDTGFNVRLRQTNPTPVRGLVARFGNVYNQGSAEAPGPSDLTIRAAVEFNQISFGVGAFVFWPIFFGGKRDLTLSPGAIVDSDLLGIDMPANVNWFLRIYGTVASGGKWPLGVLARPSHSDGVQSGTTQTDLTTSGSITTPGGDTFTYGPTGLFTPRRDRTPSVAVIGDSIPNGTGDTPVTDNGFVVRALGATVPLQFVTIPGSQVSQFTSYYATYRLVAIRECTSAIIMYGANDLGGGRTQAQIQADLLNAWTLLANLGQRVLACTITPRSSSTDSWATLANQTPHSANATRVAINDWIRGGAPIDATTKSAVAVGTAGAVLMGDVRHPAYAYYETADTVESARNSGLWKVTSSANGWTADGLHPSTAGHTAMATVIDATKLA